MAVKLNGDTYRETSFDLYNLEITYDDLHTIFKRLASDFEESIDIIIENQNTLAKEDERKNAIDTL